MTDRLRRLHALYEGRLDEVDDDAILRQELDELCEVKDLLDRRPKRRPEPATLSAVLGAARGDAEAVPHLRRRLESTVSDDPSPETRGTRVDRPPQARQRSVVLRIGAASALVVMLLAVVGILQLDLLDPSMSPASMEADQNHVATENSSRRSNPENPPATDEQPGLTESEAPLADANSQQSPTPEQSPTSNSPAASRDDVRSTAIPFSERPAARAPARALTNSFAESFAGSAAHRGEIGESAAEAGIGANNDVLSWDQQGDVMEMYENIERVGGDIAMEWEMPAVPLEMIPQNRVGEPFLQQAGERRTP